MTNAENPFLHSMALSIPARLSRLSTLGSLVQRLVLDGTTEGKDFAFAVGSVIAQEAAELSAIWETGGNFPGSCELHG